MILPQKNNLVVLDLTPIKIEKPHSTNFLFSLLEMVGVGIVAYGVGVLAEAMTFGFATPAITALVGYLAEDVINIGGFLAVDYYNGNLNTANIFLDIGLPFIRLPARLRKIYKTSNLIKRMGFEIKDVDRNLYNQLARDLYKRDWDNIIRDERKYEYLNKKYNLAENLEKWKIEKEHITSIRYNIKISSQIFKYVKKTSRIIAMARPRYLFYRGINALGKRTANKVFAYLKKWEDKKVLLLINKFKNKFQAPIRNILRTTQERLNMIIFDSSWISGVRIIPISRLSVNMHLLVFFNPTTTNNKSDVFLNNVPKLMFEKWLTSKSKGAFYLNNFAWGWEIGRWIRQNGKWKNLALAGFISNKAIATLFNIKRTINFGLKIYHNPNELINLWKNWPKELGNAIMKYIFLRANKLSHGSARPFVKQFFYKDPNAIARLFTHKLKARHKRIMRARLKGYREM